MRNIVKSIIFKLWPVVGRYLANIKSLEKINYRISMGILAKQDMIRWRVEKAREMGVKVGDNCRFYSLDIFSEPYLVEIGNNVIISGNVTFVTHDGSVYLFKDECPNIYGNFGRIKIGDNCFIGMGATILQNVEIGRNSIICAGSVVMDSFPEDSVIIGNPARIAFKRSLYKKMKLSSPFTLQHDVYPFPDEADIPAKEQEELLLKEIGSKPIRKPMAKMSSR